MLATSYLDRFLDPVTEILSPEAAESIANLQLDAETSTRVELLRSKSNEGTLTPQESAEYQEFVEALDVMSIIQSKARKLLSRRR